LRHHSAACLGCQGVNAVAPVLETTRLEELLLPGKLLGDAVDELGAELHVRHGQSFGGVGVSGGDGHGEKRVGERVQAAVVPLYKSGYVACPNKTGQISDPDVVVVF
jgi:hypothetical protein